MPGGTSSSLDSTPSTCSLRRGRRLAPEEFCPGKPEGGWIGIPTCNGKNPTKKSSTNCLTRHGYICKVIQTELVPRLTELEIRCDKCALGVGVGRRPQRHRRGRSSASPLGMCGGPPPLSVWVWVWVDAPSPLWLPWGPKSKHRHPGPGVPKLQRVDLQQRRFCYYPDECKCDALHHLTAYVDRPH